MPRIRVGSELTYRVDQPTSFLFQVAVAHNPHQPIEQEWIHVSGPGELEACRVDLDGNRLHRYPAEPGEFTLTYNATVDLAQDVVVGRELEEVPHARLPPETLRYLNPSRYCESDTLLRFAWEEFHEMPSGHARVQGIADWVNGALEYTPGSTGPTTTACDVLLQRTGVCRDYAHLSITFCRAMGIPARYVAGYAVNLQPPDFHGFFEAYLGNDWYLFDATGLASVSGFVRIGVGRDAADLAFSTRIGSAESLWVSVFAEAAGDQPAWLHPAPGTAVSSA